jgi:hypothetical protein
VLLIQDLPQLNLFIKGYIVAALWSTNDESTPDGGVPMDANYDIHDIEPRTLWKMAADCMAFFAANRKDIEAGPRKTFARQLDCTIMEYAGHDFWLTRSGHGCGYWDGDWPERVGERLTRAAKKFGEFYLFVGDGKIYH